MNLKMVIKGDHLDIGEDMELFNIKKIKSKQVRSGAKISQIRSTLAWELIIWVSLTQIIDSHANVDLICDFLVRLNHLVVRYHLQSLHRKQ